MKILILGGTVFLGRHIVDSALKKGHELTLFNRGKHNADLFPDIEKIRGDRKTDIDKLKGREWDAVIDTCGYVKSDVVKSSEVLKDNAGKYIFVSSASVYRDYKTIDMDESYPVGTVEDEDVEEMNVENYGPLKAVCEKVISKAFPKAYVNVRAGLIVGPHDISDRFTYWVRRVAEGGKVLCPGNGSTPIQYIDVRDIADWIIKMTGGDSYGTYNATGLDYTYTMHEFLKDCKSVGRSDAEFIWADDKFLEENEVAPWSDMPVWLPDSNPDYAGFSKANIDKALKDGMTFRKPADTIKATLDWDKTRTDAEEMRAGLKREREKELLNALGY